MNGLEETHQKKSSQLPKNINSFNKEQQQQETRDINNINNNKQKNTVMFLSPELFSVLVVYTNKDTNITIAPSPESIQIHNRI